MLSVHLFIALHIPDHRDRGTRHFKTRKIYSQLNWLKDPLNIWWAIFDINPLLDEFIPQSWSKNVTVSSPLYLQWKKFPGHARRICQLYKLHSCVERNKLSTVIEDIKTFCKPHYVAMSPFVQLPSSPSTFPAHAQDLHGRGKRQYQMHRAICLGNCRCGRCQHPRVEGPETDMWSFLN